MTSTCVENLEFDTEQRHRSAHFLPKLPPAVENTRKTVENVGQADRPVAENDGQVGIGVIMIRKMADDGRRPNPTRKYRMNAINEDKLTERGNVKWFDARKGFGFIIDGQGRDVFVHFSVIEGEGFRRLAEGETVQFAFVQRCQGLFATHVRRLTPAGTEPAVQKPEDAES